MEHVKTIEVPATTREVVVFVTCDLCGAKIEKQVYEVNEVEVRHKVGDSYPESGSVTETSVDMCGKCFEEKLVPWLRSQCADPRIEDWDW